MTCRRSIYTRWGNVYDSPPKVIPPCVTPNPNPERPFAIDKPPKLSVFFINVDEKEYTANFFIRQYIYIYFFLFFFLLVADDNQPYYYYYYYYLLC